MSHIIRVGLLFNYTYSFYRNVLRGVRQFAGTRPRWVFMPVLARGRRLVWRGRHAPDGVLASINTPELAKAAAHWRGPLVNVSAVIEGLPFPRVAVDNAAIGRLAAEHLLEHGLKHLAFVGHPRYLFSQERERAFRMTADEAGLQVACFYTRSDRHFEPYAQQWYLDRRIDRWLQSLPKPVGIFVAGDLLGAELTAICRELELRVPEDVSLIGVDNDDLYCELALTPLSSVIVNAKRVGYEAGALLDRLMAGTGAPSEPITVPPLGIHARRSSEAMAIDDIDVVTAVRFIRENAHRPIGVDDILRIVDVSRRALEKRFKRALGHSLGKEINRVRIQRAQRLLAETDLPMPEIAANSGFSSARHLAAVFRRELDGSPTEYRKQSRLDARPQ